MVAILSVVKIKLDWGSIRSSPRSMKDQMQVFNVEKDVV